MVPLRFRHLDKAEHDGVVGYRAAAGGDKVIDYEIKGEVREEDVGNANGTASEIERPGRK